MFTVDRIENDIVLLENRINKEIIEVNREMFSYEVKENDIVILENNKYILDDSTMQVKKDIRSRFENLKK